MAYLCVVPHDAIHGHAGVRLAFHGVALFDVGDTQAILSVDAHTGVIIDDLRRESECDMTSKKES